MPTNDTKLQLPCKSCRTCLTSHTSSISHCIMPLVINNLLGRYTYADLLDKSNFKIQVCAGQRPVHTWFKKINVKGSQAREEFEFQ